MRRQRVHRSICEALERRALLSVTFAPAPYATPNNRADIALGTFGGTQPIQPMVSVNERDPVMVAVSSQDHIRLSGNAGGSFTGNVAYPLFPGATGSAGNNDTEFDHLGRLFWTNLNRFPQTDVTLARVDPLTGAPTGATANVNASPGDPFRSDLDDKQFIAIDTFATSPFRGNVYVVWTKFDVGPGTAEEVFFSRSTDGGASFSAPIQMSNSPTQGFVWPSDVGVAPNGDVYVAWRGNPTPNTTASGTTGRILVRRSTDGGASFAPSTNAFANGETDVTLNIQGSVGTIPGARFWTQGANQPWVLPDPARPGNVYVVSADDPNNIFGNGDDGNIVFSRSTNNGSTWTRTTITSGPNNSFQLFPTAAIDRFGNIVVAWYDNRVGLTNVSGRWLLDVFATYSTDGGLTWATPFQVNDEPFDPDIGAINIFPGPPPTTRIGEYFGIDVFGGTAHVAFNGNTFDGPNPTGQQVWYDRFAIRGAITVNGDESGAATNDEILVRRLAGDPSFIEIFLNGQRQYVGLQDGLTVLTVNGLAGSDTIRVESGLVGGQGGVPMVVNAGAGDDVIRFGGAGGISQLGGGFTINGDAGNDHLFIDDATDGNDSYTITSTTFDRTFFLSLMYVTIERLTLTAQLGPNVINVNGTEAGTLLFVNGNDGTDTINVIESLAPVGILPSTGDDLVNVNTSGLGMASARFAATQRIGSLTIGAGGVASVPAGGDKVLTITSFTASGNATLDLEDNDLIVDYAGASPIDNVVGFLSTGYNGGAWTGPGISSSSAATTAGRALGYAEASEIFTSFPAIFSGQTVDNTAVLIRYTLYGDANLNGTVNLVDFNRLAANFGLPARRWAHGDFNFDGLVTLVDFNRLAGNFGMTQGRVTEDDVEQVDEDLNDPIV